MKAVLSSLSDVPDALREEYEERDGKYYLKLDGQLPGLVKEDDLREANQKLAEFRDSNRGLKSTIDELKSKYDGVDVDEHKKLKDRIAELEKRGLGGGEDVDAQLRKMLEEKVTPLQKQVEELTERERAAKAELSRKELESILREEGVNAGIAEKAIPDFLRRAHEVWHYEEGKPIARKGDEPLFSDKKPSEPLSPREWIVGLAEEAPHLFKSNSGGGAKGGAGSGADNGAATFDADDPKDFLANVDQIAKGKMVRRQT